jgi:tetratricopeptide (TPR) repeat protein
MAEKARTDIRARVDHETRDLVLGAVPVALVGALLVLATWSDGAFDIRHWAPAAVLACLLLAAIQVAGGLSRPSGPVLVAVAAIWAFAGLTLLSAAWAESPVRAWEGGIRTVLYAALVTLALLSLPDRRQVRAIAAGIVLGTVGIAFFTLGTMQFDGLETFLAGRLDDPVGYRNGTAALFAFATWPLIGAAAPRGSNPALRAGAMTAAVLMLGLAFLTQSRGVLIGVAAGAVVSIAIGPDRLRRAWLGIALVGAIGAASHELLTPYRAFDGGAGTVEAGDVSTAADALLVICGATFVVGLCLAVLDNGLRGDERASGAMHRLATWALAGIGAVAVVGALVMIGNPVSYADDKVDEFTALESSPDPGETRLGSVGGQRYDLWRVAVEEFQDDPVGGVGEGSYVYGYYRERKTDRNLNNAHSLPFQMLAETGLVGLGLFAAFLIGLGAAITRAARSAEAAERRLVAGMAAAGAAILAQATTDWLWLIPGLMGLAFLALGLAARQGRDEHGPVGIPWRIGLAMPLLALAVSGGLLYLSDTQLRLAREHKAEGEVAAQLEAAEAAENLSPTSVEALYLRASALETQGEEREARRALREALEREPGNFVTLALLGDLEVRAGNPEAARALYARAAEENPLDVGLAELSELERRDGEG